MTPLASQIEAATGYAPRTLTPLGGGCVAEVWRADLADGSRIVVNRGEGLKLEAWRNSAGAICKRCWPP